MHFILASCDFDTRCIVFSYKASVVCDCPTAAFRKIECVVVVVITRMRMRAASNYIRYDYVANAVDNGDVLLEAGDGTTDNNAEPKPLLSKKYKHYAHVHPFAPLSRCARVACRVSLRVCRFGPLFVHLCKRKSAVCF